MVSSLTEILFCILLNHRIKFSQITENSSYIRIIKRVYQSMNQLKNLDNSTFNIIVNKLMQLYGVWDISDFLN